MCACMHVHMTCMSLKWTSCLLLPLPLQPSPGGGSGIGVQCGAQRSRLKREAIFLISSPFRGGCLQSTPWLSLHRDPLRYCFLRLFPDFCYDKQLTMKSLCILLGAYLQNKILEGELRNSQNVECSVLHTTTHQVLSRIW